MDILYWIIFGLVTGWLTSGLLMGNGYGPIMDAVMGIAGALAAGSVVRLSVPPAHDGVLFTVLAAVFGAFVLTSITAYANGRRTLSLSLSPPSAVREFQETKSAKQN